MFSLFAVLCVLFPLLLLFFIPLPKDIADSKKLYVVELLFRITNEYGGELVENIFGAAVRNKYTRLVMSIGFYLPIPHPKDIKVEWIRVNGVRVRYYRPPNANSTAIIYIHGGGWSTMRPQYYDFVLYPLIRRLGCSLFSIDYRLAPEHPYPAAIEDCEAVIRELYKKGQKEFGVDPSRLAVMGDSAGGNLAAVMSHRLRKEKMVKCQVLIYPVTTVFSFNFPSYREYFSNYDGTSLLNPSSMARWILLYLNINADKENSRKLISSDHVPRGKEKLLDQILAQTEETMRIRSDDHLISQFKDRGLHPDVSPLLAPDLTSLPPTMVLTAGYDILRDEGRLYARRLKEASIDVTAKHYETAYHGVLNMPFSRVKGQMMKDIRIFLSQKL